MSLQQIFAYLTAHGWTCFWTGVYVVARVARVRATGDVVDPEIVVTPDTGTTIVPDDAAREYSKKQPGTKLAVWALGEYPTQYAVSETGGLHQLERNSIREHG